MAIIGLYVLLAALIGPQLGVAQDILSQGVPCKDAKCPKATWGHYNARACEPVIDPELSQCCPSSFDCKTEEQRGILKNVCVYKNVTYNIGDKVPIENPCEVDCRCDERLVSGLAQVECASVECPSLFGVFPEPGCRSIYSVDKCCSVDEECNTSPASIRASTCVLGDKEFKYGDRIYFDDEPCRQCICTEHFNATTTGAYGPNCTEIDCGREYRDRSELEKGCIPLYFDNRCCNIDYICPGSTLVNGTAEQVATGEETPATHCTLGDIVAPRNTSLATTNCNTNCFCATPPTFSCIQYADCDKAAAAKAQGRFEF